ncbi:hypothetical protein Tco_0994025 [Tanacetum coccineum]
MLAICNVDVPVKHKAPNTSSYTRKKDSKGKKPGAKSGHRKQPTSSKHHPFPKIEETKCRSYKAPTGSKTGHLVKETQSSSALDTNPSQPPPSTPVVAGLHKEDQQATGGLTSLGVTSEGRAKPQLNSTKFKARADSGLSAPKDSISQTIGRCADDFNDLDSPNDDEPIIVQDESDEEVHAKKSQNHKLEKQKSKAEVEIAILSAQPTFLNVEQLTKLLIKLDLEKNKAEAEVALLLAQPSFPNVAQLTQLLFNELTGEVKELKKHVHELEIEIELPGDLKEIPNKLEELPAEFLSVRTQLQSIQAKLKTLDALLSLLSNVTKALNKFARVIDSASTLSLQSPFLLSPPKSSSQPEGEHIKNDNGKKAMSSKDAEEEGSESGDHVHLTEEQIKEQKKIKESAKVEAAKHEVEVRKEELVYLLSPDVVSKEVVKACPYRKGKGWSTIYGQIQTRIDYLHETEAELGIDLDKPLSEQDPLDKLNDLAKKKRKNVDDLHDYFKENKRLKSSDFVTIEDFRDFPNEMLYTVQEIFFRLHQGPRLDDHAKTFSSLLLAEVEKRNLNPLKQMRTIEQLRQ